MSLVGRKRWFFYPPGRATVSRRGLPLIGTEGWALNILPNLAPRDRPYTFVQHPGEAVYLPEGWSHATYNLDELVLGFGEQKGLTAGILDQLKPACPISLLRKAAAKHRRKQKQEQQLANAAFEEVDVDPEACVLLGMENLQRAMMRGDDRDRVGRRDLRNLTAYFDLPSPHAPLHLRLQLKLAYALAQVGDVEGHDQVIYSAASELAGAEDELKTSPSKASSSSSSSISPGGGSPPPVVDLVDIAAQWAALGTALQQQHGDDQVHQGAEVLCQRALAIMAEAGEATRFLVLAAGIPLA